MSRAKDKWVCTYHAAIFAVINYLQRIDSCTLRLENIKYEIYNKTVAKIGRKILEMYYLQKYKNE